MSNKKLYSEEEKKSIEEVLDMGLFIENSNGDTLTSIFGDYEIRFHNGNITEYTSIERALNKFLKNQ